jgi:hypothetical protein
MLIDISNKFSIDNFLLIISSEKDMNVLFFFVRKALIQNLLKKLKYELVLFFFDVIDFLLSKFLLIFSLNETFLKILI